VEGNLTFSAGRMGEEAWFCGKLPEVLLDYETKLMWQEEG